MRGFGEAKGKLELMAEVLGRLVLPAPVIPAKAGVPPPRRR